MSDRTRYANQRHAYLSETSAGADKGLFPRPLAQMALRFFATSPTRNGALDGGAAGREQVGGAAWPARSGPTYGACGRNCGRSPPRC